MGKRSRGCWDHLPRWQEKLLLRPDRDSLSGIRFAADRRSVNRAGQECGNAAAEPSSSRPPPDSNAEQERRPAPRAQREAAELLEALWETNPFSWSGSKKEQRSVFRPRAVCEGRGAQLCSWRSNAEQQHSLSTSGLCFWKSNLILEQNLQNRLQVLRETIWLPGSAERQNSSEI